MLLVARLPSPSLRISCCSCRSYVSPHCLCICLPIVCQLKRRRVSEIAQRNKKKTDAVAVCVRLSAVIEIDYLPFLAFVASLLAVA